MLKHLERVTRSPRFWALLSSLLMRGSGFVASFSLSRVLGSMSLALYISTVITAAAVANPVAQVFFNGATMGSTTAPSAPWLRSLFWANMRMAMLMLLPVCALFFVMHWPLASSLSDALHVSHTWLLVAAFSAVAGPVFVAILTGLLNGAGAQTRAAKWQALISGTLMCTSYPAVSHFGMAGAWAVLLASSWVPVAALGFLLHNVLGHQWLPQVQADAVSTQIPGQVVKAHLWDGLPNVVALAVGGGVSWFCSIYLVQRLLGAQAVATLAVANQWMTLMLLPATSWGGVMLQEVARARADNLKLSALRALIRRLLKRNILVTLVVVVVVVLFTPIIEQAYRLNGRGLGGLLVVSGLASIACASHGVFERVLIGWGMQADLMKAVLLGLAVQALFTLVFVSHSVVVVQMGAVLAALTSLGLCVYFLKQAWGRR